MRAHLLRTAFTEAEYLALADASIDKLEFIDGAILDMAGGTEEHALVGANVIGALQRRVRGGPCRTCSSDLRVWAPSARSYVHPDATVVCGPAEKATTKGDRLSIRNPSLIVEVVSPGTEDYDRNDKLAIYAAIPTVRDYLIVDVDARTVEHHSRTENGPLRRSVVSAGDLALSIGISLPLAEIFADLP